MSIPSKLDTRAFLNNFQTPILVFSEDEIFFNDYFKEYIYHDFKSWREVFQDEVVRKILEEFFETGKLNISDFTSILDHKIEGQILYSWDFTIFPAEEGVPYCVGKATRHVPMIDMISDEYLQSGTTGGSMKYLKFVSSILKNSHDMLVILDKDGRYKFISYAVIEKFQIQPSEIIGKSFIDFVNKGILEIQSEDIQRIWDSKGEIKLNFIVNHPKKGKVYIESYCRNLLHDPDVAGYLFSARDITEFWQAKESLQKRYELENLINRISAKFVNAGFEQLDQIFNESLEMLGVFEQADRAYIFMVHHEVSAIENVYEWVSDGIEPQIQYLKHIPYNLEETVTIASLIKGEILVVPDVDYMPEKFAYEMEVYKSQGILSFMLIPIFSENKLIGFFGLDAVRQKRAWHEKDEYVLRQLGDIYAGAFINKAIKKRLERNERLLESTEILAKSGSWLYSNFIKRIYFSEGLRRIFDLDEDLQSASFSQFIRMIKKQDRRPLLDNIDLATLHKSTCSGEFTIYTKDGKERVISYNIQVNGIPGSDEDEIFGYCTDVTHKRDAENYLKLQSQILAQVDDPIFVTDHKLRVIYINQAGRKECEIVNEELVDVKITELFDFVSYDNKESFVEKLQKLNQKDGFRGQLDLIDRFGKTEPHEVSVQQFLNDEREMIGYSFIIRNLSEQLRKEMIAKKAQTIVESSPAVLFTVNPNDRFRVIYISDNFRQFGYSAKETMQNGLSMLDIIHPDDVVSMLDYHYSKETEDGLPAFSGEYRIKKADGTYRWVEDRTREVYDHKGKITLHEGILQDITERKQHREEILRSEERYRVLASNIPGTTIFLIDRDLRYIVAQGTTFADWGMSSKDFEGKTLAEVHQTNLSDFQPFVTRALLKNEIAQKNVLYKRRVYELTIKPITYEGEVEYALGILRDINEEYRAKEELRKNEEKYRKLVEESTEIIFSIDMSMNMTYISPNVKQFLGYSSEYVMGKKIIEFLHPDDMQAFIERKVNSPEFLRENPYLEFRLQHQNGKYRIFSSNGKLVMDEETNNKMYYTGIARDITKLKEAQKELFLAKEKAEQASTVKSQFLSIMSHEIRTPMNAVIGMAHLLIEDDPRPDQLENLKTLQFSAENLLGLINDILDYSKIDSGKIELEQVGFELENVFTRILHSYSYQAREKNLEILFEVDKDMPKTLIGDPVRLGQIVNNLVSNAIKFTEEGYVKIRLIKKKETQKTVTIQFDFEDTGIGIPEEKLELIFEAFTQATAATTRKYGGTGLGLAIVKRLVNLFGGEIKALQRPEKGTIFTFTSTFQKPTGDTLEKDQSIEGKEGIIKNARILVAEDNLVNQIMIKKFLDKWGVKEVFIANDGNEAIAAIQKSSFDLILLDLQMPEKDGFQVAQYVRGLKNETKRNMPIIALTASSLIEVKEQLESVGMNDYISKPFNPDNLYAKIIKYLNG